MGVPPTVPSDGTAETGVRVDSVAFFQLALLDAPDVTRVVRGGGLRSGICICGLAFLNRCLGVVSGAWTMASIVCVGVGVLTLTTGRSRILRALVRSSRSFCALE